MKIVIHPGMHKTGSSAIQDHFFKTAYPGLRYARWNSGNHSAMFVLLFQEPELLAEYHGFKPRGPEFYARLPQMREDWRASLTEDLTRAQAAGETLVFSAEDISGPQFHGAVGRMAAFFREWSEDITVLAYARRPLSYATSAFQERLKGGTVETLEAEKLWPFYKARFARLDEVFGRERVILKPYDREHLSGGDVVRDFATTIGVEMATAPASEANTSLSAESTALLFAQRRLGKGFVTGFDKAQAANRAFIDALRGIGSSKLTFSDSLWGSVLEKNRADLDWIEDRLGMPLRDTPTPNAIAIAISGEEDLFRLAEENQPALETALLSTLHRDQRPALDRTVSTLELLRRLSYDPYSSL
ncbi:hypothetical protein RA2_04301 [Roseovarius sp. A-2]|uniref:hypothetical protein n=1 Tax=Roseovarius sp. A-2 TaxID=1570360 RepID=UPI0009B596DA|nr:hypothetical protein [Roseovarius sp. A-2]GAW37225.1 hypothetical protein RA2_04301 [Roseovarius sp. A-2]